MRPNNPTPMAVTRMCMVIRGWLPKLVSYHCQWGESTRIVCGTPSFPFLIWALRTSPLWAGRQLNPAIDSEGGITPGDSS